MNKVTNYIGSKNFLMSFPNGFGLGESSYAGIIRITSKLESFSSGFGHEHLGLKVARVYREL